MTRDTVRVRLFVEMPDGTTAIATRDRRPTNSESGLSAAALLVDQARDQLLAMLRTSEGLEP